MLINWRMVAQGFTEGILLSPEPSKKTMILSCKAIRARIASSERVLSGSGEFGWLGGVWAMVSLNKRFHMIHQIPHLTQQIKTLICADISPESVRQIKRDMQHIIDDLKTKAKSSKKLTCARPLHSFNLFFPSYNVE